MTGDIVVIRNQRWPYAFLNGRIGEVIGLIDAGFVPDHELDIRLACPVLKVFRVVRVSNSPLWNSVRRASPLEQLAAFG